MPSGSEEQEEELRPWVRKPFEKLVSNLKQLKGQYVALEQTLMGIGRELKVPPLQALDGVKKLPKAQAMADLQARVDCLLKENGELRTHVEEGEAQRKELEELKDWVKAIEEELKSAREDRDKAVVMAQKFHAFMGYPGDVVNKAWLYDKSTSQPGTSLGSKIIRCMVDYSTKIEKLLREMRILL